MDRDKWYLVIPLKPPRPVIAFPFETKEEAIEALESAPKVALPFVTKLNKNVTITLDTILGENVVMDNSP